MHESLERVFFWSAGKFGEALNHSPFGPTFGGLELFLGNFFVWKKNNKKEGRDRNLKLKFNKNVGGKMMVKKKKKKYIYI